MLVLVLSVGIFLRAYERSIIRKARRLQERGRNREDQGEAPGKAGKV